MNPYLPVLVVLAALTVTACEPQTDCTPTRTHADNATKVNLGAVSRSATVTATLVGGEPLAGRTLTFEILDDSASVYTVDATTGTDGVATADLKRADADALLAIVRADAFRATFDGDATYCRSSDRAAFHATR